MNASHWMHRVASREGLAGAGALDGSEALVHLARGDSIDLMVLDPEMPMLGGREVEVMEQGADDYIRKPIDPPRFPTRIKAALRRAKG